MKQGKAAWSRTKGGKSDNDDNENTLEAVCDREVMRLFARVEQKRRDVEERERKYEQREQQQEDDELEKERKSRQFDKSWRKEDRVDKRIGNWREFNVNKKHKM
jgi:hypothetical protein